MKINGIFFDGSDSLFQTQQSLVTEMGHAVWLPQFTPTRLDHLTFVHRLLQTFCELDICCTITGTYPAYIASVLTSYYNITPCIGGLHIARTSNSIFDNFYRKADTFVIEPFQFRIVERQEYKSFPDYSNYEITFEDVTLAFSVTIIDASTFYGEPVYCGSRSNINLSEFIWEYMCSFAVKTYSIVCVPLNTPTVLYLQHHRSNSDGWESLVLCKNCLKEILSILQPMVGNSTLDPTCRCNVCLRQPPSLRNLASHTVFHYTFNSSQFTLTVRTLYHQYLYAVESQEVSGKG